MVQPSSALSDLAILRLGEEKENIKKNRKTLKEGFSLKPMKKGMAEDLSQWRLEFIGRPGTIWEGPVYSGTFKIPKDYPERAPIFIFDKLDGKESLQHINVFSDGSVCIDVLKTAYKPERTLLELAEHIEGMLYTPNPRSPANSLLSGLYTMSKKEYESKIKAQAERIKAYQDSIPKK